MTAGSAFPLLIYSNTATSGVVTMATGVMGGTTGATSGNIAQLTFRPKVALCGSDLGLGFASSGFTNLITDLNGQAVAFTPAVNVSVNGLGAFPITGTPGSVSGQPCDAGQRSAAVASVSNAAPAAQDSCGHPLTVSLKVNGSPASMPSVFPVGTTTLAWTATDAAGNTATTTASVQVDDRQVATVTASLVGVSVGGSTRAMNLAYSGGPSGGQPASIATTVTNGTAAGTVDVDIAPAVLAAPACASLKDPVHSLRALNSPSGSSGAFGISGTKWTVGFTLTQGDSNNDDLVDIRDFGLYVGDYSTAGTTPSGARSNFNGDGDVDTADFTFISANFFAIGSGCSAAWHDRPLASVTVKQLRRMGMGDLAIADVNGDGRVDSADIAAFMAGRRAGEATRNAGTGGVAE